MKCWGKPADTTSSKTGNQPVNNGSSTASNGPIPAVLTAIPEPAAKPTPSSKNTAPTAKPTSLVSTPKVYVLNTAVAKAAGFNPKGPNDLTVIEGIGPKINELFSNAGIITFAQLAKQTVPQMQKILDEAGAGYKLAKPTTWAQQAALAAENKWSELKALQDKLTGGV
ncbi:MAG TPA: hypothetical protein VES38_09165 [Methylotenera sp.]|nr:hypothetical protein [Methylotenera sp.]